MTTPISITVKQIEDAITELDIFLDDLYEYFDRSADIDNEGGPNEAMRWQNRINELRGTR